MIATDPLILTYKPAEKSEGLMTFVPCRDEKGVVSSLELSWLNQEASRLCGQFAPVNPGFRVVINQKQDYALGTCLVHMLKTGDYAFLKASSDCLLKLRLESLESSYLLRIEDVSDSFDSERSLLSEPNLEPMSTVVGGLLAGVRYEEIDDCLNKALRQIGLYLSVDRVALVMYSPDQVYGNCYHQWNRPEVVPATRYQGVNATVVPWWHTRMLNGEVIGLTTLEELPAEAKLEKEVLEEQRVKSLLCVPLVINGRTHGFLSLDTILRKRLWADSEIQVLRVLGQNMISVWQHRQDEDNLRRAHQRLEGIRAIESAMLRSLGSAQPELAALQHLQELVPCQRLSIFSIDEGANLAHLEGRYMNGVLNARPGFSMPANYFDLDRLRKGTAVHAPDLTPMQIDELPADLGLSGLGYRSMLVLPFLRQGRLSGCLVMMAKIPYFFTDEYIDIATEVSGQLALVFHQRQLDEQLRQYTEELERRVEDRTNTMRELMEMRQAVFQHAGIGILTINKDGLIESVNPALEALLGYQAKELIGQPMATSLDAPQTRGNTVSCEQQLQDYFQTRQAVQREALLQCKDGRLLPVLATISPLYDAEDNLNGYIKVVTDISALKQTQEELKVASRRLQLATRAAGLGIWELDLRKGEVVWDERLHQIHGTLPESFKGTFDEFVKLIHPEDLPSFMAQRDKRFETSDFFQDDLRIIRPDGVMCHTETVALLVRDEDGVPTNIVGVVRDITQRKQSELELKESQQRFREIAEMVDDVFYIRSAPDLRFLYMSPAYERITGRSIEDIYADSSILLDVIPDEDKEEMFSKFASVFTEDTVMKYRVKDQLGNLRWVLDRVYVVRNSEGQPVRYVGLASDITVEVEKERILTESLERERELNRLKSSFVSTVSHEFRTPLATIQSSVEIIKLYLAPFIQTIPVRVGRHLDVIEGEIEKFSNLLTDILTLGRIESGKVQIEAVPTDLEDLCRQVLATHFSERKDNRSVRLMIEGGTQPTVVIDPKLIGHVLVNLLSNAFKFSSDDPYLAVEVADKEATIRVIDKGIGIPPADTPHLFERFFRASNAGTIPGTGLGLVISRQFVEMHDGTLEVVSELGHGSTFTIRLPHKQ